MVRQWVLVSVPDPSVCRDDRSGDSGSAAD
jgi:hypothetical protein